MKTLLSDCLSVVRFAETQYVKKKKIQRPTERYL